MRPRARDAASREGRSPLRRPALRSGAGALSGTCGLAARFACLVTLVPLVALGASTALFATACGHAATREECEEIFRRSAELELKAQNVTDPKLVAERTEAVRAARGEELIGRCVGKRITTSALECVRKAQAPNDLDECLD